MKLGARGPCVAAFLLAGAKAHELVTPDEICAVDDNVDAAAKRVEVGVFSCGMTLIQNCHGFDLSSSIRLCRLFAFAIEGVRSQTYERWCS